MQKNVRGKIFVIAFLIKRIDFIKDLLRLNSLRFMKEYQKSESFLKQRLLVSFQRI